MGHYGKEITSSDDYHDFTADLYGFFGYIESEDDDYEKRDSFLNKEIVQDRLPELKEWFNDNYNLQTDLQFLAYHLVRLGVDLPNETIAHFIEEFKNDSWAEHDLERRIYMNKAVLKLEEYKKNNAPIDIDVIFDDFELYYIKKSTNIDILSPNEISKLIEENTDIKIKQILSDNYSLFMVISRDDYKKTNGSIFGIKFITEL